MRLFQVDAFTTEAFRGNPAAVCILDAARDGDWMAAVAREMNLSETAFLERRADGWGLRWFTPAIEVELCGHATLASAHVLWETDIAAPDETIRFDTLSGVLAARRAGDRIVLDFPAEPATTVPWVVPLLEALAVAEPVGFARNRFDYLVEVADAAQVRALRPDMTLLATVPTRGVIVTARSDTDEFDFVSRWFGPRSGVDEDPVTGSAHCCLGPWWAERLGRDDLRAIQLSARSGVLGVRVLDGRVELAGNAVTVLRGELLA